MLPRSCAKFDSNPRADEKCVGSCCVGVDWISGVKALTATILVLLDRMSQW